MQIACPLVHHIQDERVLVDSKNAAVMTYNDEKKNKMNPGKKSWKMTLMIQLTSETKPNLLVDKKMWKDANEFRIRSTLPGCKNRHSYGSVSDCRAQTNHIADKNFSIDSKNPEKTAKKNQAKRQKSNIEGRMKHVPGWYKKPMRKNRLVCKPRKLSNSVFANDSGCKLPRALSCRQALFIDTLNAIEKAERIKKHKI